MSLPILLDVIKDIIIFELFTLDIILFPPPLVVKDCEAVKHELLVSSVLQFFPRIMYYVCLAVRATVKPWYHYAYNCILKSVKFDRLVLEIFIYFM